MIALVGGTVDSHKIRSQLRGVHRPLRERQREKITITTERMEVDERGT